MFIKISYPSGLGAVVFCMTSLRVDGIATGVDDVSGPPTTPVAEVLDNDQYEHRWISLVQHLWGYTLSAN